MEVTNLLILIFVPLIFAHDWSTLNLVKSHIPYVLHHQTRLKKLCLKDPSCPFKKEAKQKACWGFESGCKKSFGSSHPTVDCSSPKSKARYWNQADFGYVEQQLQELKDGVICKKTKTHPSSLRCTRDATMCRARNLYMDLRRINDKADRQFKVVLRGDEIGGYCKLDQTKLDTEARLTRDLSSWGEQLRPYSQLKVNPFSDPSTHCDTVITKPVIFVQLDFGGNMYHHFCDFFNIYLTQLVNQSSFGTDVHIVRWSGTYRYGEFFGESWKAFINSNLTSLYHFGENRVCIADAIFAFLPRIPLGLFYSTPLENHCRGTGLFRAFTQHFLHRMGVVDENLLPIPSLSYVEHPERIRVTLIDRNFTDKYKIYRIIVNQEELVQAIKEKIPDVDVEVYKYSSTMPFEDQLRITHNTDIFIGMHGAGLAHFLFLPDWAVAFELYNCEDPRCYRDLARLRGLHYMTWEHDEKLTVHKAGADDNFAKFWNFSFDVDEFIRLVLKARSHLLRHPRFKKLAKRDEL